MPIYSILFSSPLATTTAAGLMPALPLNYLLFGTATGPSSSASLQWDDVGKILTVGGALNITGVITKKGTGTPAGLSALGMQSYDTVAGWFQDNVQNLSNGVSSSSDMVCTADTGTDSINYIDTGINSSGYGDSGYTIGGALSGYLLCNGGDLTIGTATAAKVLKFHTGGTLAANEAMRVDGSQNVLIGATTVGASAAKCLAFGVAATPPGASAGLAHLYAANGNGANTACLSIWQEYAPYAGVAVASTTKVPHRVNGTTYYLLATTVA